MFASLPSKKSDAVAELGFPVVTARWHLRGPLLNKAWDLGIGATPKGFDLVHATSLAVPPTKAKLVVTVPDLAWQAHPEAFPARGLRWHEKALHSAVGRADLFVVFSKETRAALVALGAPEANVVVIELGADHLPSGCEPYGQKLLSQMDVQGPFVLCVGTLEPRKNLTRLMQAWRLARSQLSESWTMVLVGPTGWGQEVKPTPGAVLAGAVSEETLAGLYRLASCVAYVPLLEGFGLPAVEAMAAGTAVVASPMPSLGGAAIEVDPMSVASISQGLVSVACDPTLRERLVQKGLQRAATLTWESTARQHVQAWKSVMERP